jgi:GNAT superfamily N-acetyltransferase
MTELVVVPFEPRHAEAWRTLNEAWINRFFKLEYKDREVIDDPDGQILSRGGSIYIAELGGQPVGCAALLPMDDGGYELGKMATAFDVQRRGVARAVLAACIERARSAGAPRLYLETNSSLTPAITLYRSVGFVDLPPRESPYARADVFMELRL